MSQPMIYITANDAEKLRDLIWQAQNGDYRNSPYLSMLAAELNRAVIVDPQDVPANVITMNSEAVLTDLETGETMTYKLVFPEDADPIEGKVSVLAPIGTAMLGVKVGDTFEWDTPDGRCKMRVDSVVFQPEASGDYR